MGWRVEKSIVTRRVWGPGDTYLTAGFDGPQVDGRGFVEGDTIYRLVSDYTKDPDELYEQVNKDSTQ